MKNIYCYDTKIGKISICESKGKITDIIFGEKTKLSDEYKICETDIIKNCRNQLYEYFDKKRKTFNLPLNPKGTEFMLKVYNELLKIPYGKTKCYKDIALSINNPNASRAVGMANNKNPIPIIIPCHRVIGKDGKLVGYGGGLEIKKFLLELEKENK